MHTMSVSWQNLMHLMAFHKMPLKFKFQNCRDVRVYESGK